MYSWIASWFNEENNGEQSSEQALYAENTENPNNTKEEWTWIEVLEKENYSGLIFIQSDESVRNNATVAGPIMKAKRQRRISKSDMIGRKVFKRSLYTDLPLIRKKYRHMRRVKSCSIDNATKSLCKRQQTTSDILSLTFPTDELLRIPQRCDFDVTNLFENACFVKSVLEGAFNEAQISFGLQQWLDQLVQHDRERRARTAEEWMRQLTNTWKKNGQMCIEWRKEGPLTREEYEKQVAESTDLTVIERRYMISRWMLGIDVFDQYEDVADWLKNINVSFFNHPWETEPVCYVEKLTDIPAWMRRMDLCAEPRLTRDRKSSLLQLPLWMKRIDLFDEENGEFDHVHIPTWMSAIEFFDDSNISTLADEGIEIKTCYNYDVERAKSWTFASDYIYQSSWVTPRRMWIQPVNTESLLNNAQSICSSMINIAVVLATATCKTTREKSVELLQQVPQVIQIGTKNQKCLKNAVVEQKRRITTRSSMKKNKKWLNKINTVSKLQVKVKKHTARNFSGSKSVRAC